MNEEWCRDKLEKLKISETRTGALQEIKDQVVREPENHLFLNFMQSELLNCCSDTSDEQTSIACDILAICMSNFTLDQTQNAQTVIEKALLNSNSKVQTIGIKELVRILDHAGSINTIVDENLINTLFKCLQSPEVGVGVGSLDALVKTLPAFIDTSIVRENFEKLLKCDDVVRCRGYEIAIRLSQKSAELHAKLEYVLDRAVSEMESTDVLVQMNVLTLLSDLPLTQHGLVYLENKDIFNTLLKKIHAMQESSIANLLGPGLIRFFGNVASKQPEKIFNGYPSVVLLLFDCLASSKEVLPTALDTLGHLARTGSGKKHLDAVDGNKMQEALKSIASDMQSLPTDLKIRAIHCLSAIFATSDFVDNQISSITQSWFETVSPTGDLTFVMSYCKNPFPEFKLAGIELLKAVITYRWGHEAVLRTGGFIEYLLDRKVDNNKDAALEKYEVIKILSDSSVLDAQLLLQLKSYVKEGAFFVQGIMEVAVDGSA